MGKGRTSNNSKSKRTRQDLDKSDDQIDSFEDLVYRMQGMFDSSNSKIEEKIETSVRELKTEISTLRNDVHQLKAECSRDITGLKESVSRLNADLQSNRDFVDRSRRMNELLLNGVPYSPSESLQAWTVKLSAVLGFNGADVPLIQAKRLARYPISSGSTPTILLQFAFNTSRNEFYSRYLAARNLSLVNIGFDVDKRIYINENLTEGARKIKSAAVKLKKSGKIHSVFTKDGIVYVRPQQGAVAQPIHSLDLLDPAN